MLLWLLLMHLAIHLLTATRDAPEITNNAVRPIDKQYVVKQIDSCPDVGYFFKRETTPNELTPGPCYLCFCQGQESAVCWKRDNKRCDVESFHYHGVGKRDTRVRRSPAGLSDIFFRDAVRDVFNKGSPQQCKPYESSFSDGCPPADWCIGCTVCDCDANGRWDCHILSFCPDSKKGNKRIRKKKQRVKMPKTTEPSANRPPTTALSSTKRITGKYVDKPKTQTKRITRMKRTQPRPRIVKKSAPKVTAKPPKRKPPLRFRKVAAKNVTVRPKIINKNVATHKPIDIVKRTKMQKILNANNDTVKMAQQVVKRVMAVVQKMVRNEMKNLTKLMGQSPKPSYKKVNKRHVKKGTIKKNPIKKYFKRNKRNAMVLNIDSGATMQGDKLSPNITNKTTGPEENSPVPARVEYVKSTPTSTFNETVYYKYSLGIDQLTTDKPIVMKDVYQTETVLNLITTEKSKQFAYNESDNDRNEITSMLDTFPDANDLKFKKWSFVKILKEKYNIRSEPNNTRLSNLIPKNKVHSKDIERKLFTKKYNVVKVVNSHKMAPEEAHPNQTTAQTIRNKISDLQNSVSKLFSQFNKNNTVITKTKHRRVGIMKYLRRLFRKMFKRKKTGIDRLTEFKVIESLCDHFGPCKVNIKDKILLKSKLKDLNDETMKILKIIQILKGLLQLVDVPIKSEDNTSRTLSFSNDIQKLNSILKDTYIKDENIALSATQTTQINYIKKNTQHFVESVSKFATLLNEIVAILIKNNSRSGDHLYRILRDTENKKVEEDPFKNFKRLLIRYNLVQNDFIKKMYKMLSDFEKKIKETKVSDEHNDLNNTIAIETFSTNIITNLRKLKQVAQLLNSSGRMKRNTILKEDSIEYVLMVMEYLMRQNHPLDAAPANDGIDLLIDAIRNAPDIKSIKKKVLEYKPSTSINSNDTESAQNSDSNDNNGSSADKPPREDSISSGNDSKDFVDPLLEEDKEIDSEPLLDKKEDEVTEIYYKAAENTNTDIANVIETSSQTISTVNQEDVQELADDINGSKVDADTESVKTHPPLSDSDKKEVDVSDNDKKEADVGNIDDRKQYDMGPDTNNDLSLPQAIPPIVDNEVMPRAITSVTDGNETKDPASEPEIATVSMKSYNLDQSPESREDKFNYDTKSHLDWIEENFGMDTRRLPNISDATTSTAIPNITNVDVASISQIKSNDSIIVNDLDGNKKKKKINAEEVMLRKQMDLLNSLDYGTERSDFEDSDSKDSNDERYSSDFPAYFV